MALSIADQYYLKAVDYYPYNLEEVVENLNYALSYNPEHVRANTLMGTLYLEQMHDYELSAGYFEAALCADPTYFKACEGYATLFVRTGKYAEAKRLMDFAHTIPGADRGKLFYLEALLNERQQQFEAALGLLRQAVMQTTEQEFFNFLERELYRIKRKVALSNRYQYSLVR